MNFRVRAGARDSSALQRASKIGNFREICLCGFVFPGRLMAGVARARAIMLQSGKMFFLVGTPIAIALAATATALALQNHFGRSGSFAAIGTLLGASGAASFPLWLKNRR